MLGGGQESRDQPIHVLLCPDQPSWAFDNIANNIALYAGRNRISKLYMRDVIDSEHLLFETIFLKRIDLCHIFWREDLFYLMHPAILKKAADRIGFDYETMVRAINSCAFTTSVYDHLFCEEHELQRRRSNFVLTDGYTVSSRKLKMIYESQPDLPGPDCIIHDGVDVERFSPFYERERDDGKYVIGWVGNSAWGKSSQRWDVKGYHRLFVPMMNELRARGYTVEARVADPQINRVRFEDMPDFYRGLDVFVCTSAMEGTPNPVLEAMACGVPVVSTDVGIVPEAFGELQEQSIVAQANTQAMAQSVMKLLDDNNLRRQVGQENRARAIDWSWEVKTRPWWPFWEGVISRAMESRMATRREIYLNALVHQF